MIPTIIPKGELRRRARQKNMLNDLIWVSDCNEYADVELITLTQWLREKAFEQAWDDSKDPGEVNIRAQELLKTTHKGAKEFVYVAPDGNVQVGLAVDAIDSYDILDRAIVLLTKVEELTPGKKFEFGDWVQVFDTK